MTEDNKDAETVRPAVHGVETIASGYLKRRLSLIVYPALLNAGSAIVVLMICYVLGTAVVALVRPTGLSHEVIRTAIGWLAILYTMMIVGISLQGLWFLSKSEITAAHRKPAAPSPQAPERK
jgi:drug/metabolite transporter (DMT)-like permease